MSLWGWLANVRKGFCGFVFQCCHLNPLMLFQLLEILVYNSLNSWGLVAACALGTQAVQCTQIPVPHLLVAVCGTSAGPCLSSQPLCLRGWTPYSLSGVLLWPLSFLMVRRSFSCSRPDPLLIAVSLCASMSLVQSSLWIRLRYLYLLKMVMQMYKGIIKHLSSQCDSSSSSAVLFSTMNLQIAYSCMLFVVVFSLKPVVYSIPCSPWLFFLGSGRYCSNRSQGGKQHNCIRLSFPSKLFFFCFLLV